MILLLLPVCLGLVVFALARRARVTAALFPDAPPEDVARWRRLELWSLGILGISAGVVLVLALGATLLLAGLGLLLNDPDHVLPLLMRFGPFSLALAGLLVIGLVFSALVGTRAAPLRRKLGTVTTLAAESGDRP